MYLPEAFAERDPALLARFIDAFPLGLLITSGQRGPTSDAGAADAEAAEARVSETSAGMIAANLLPFEFAAGAAGSGVLRAHIARANPLWQATSSARADLDASSEVLVVFQGPQSYVSPGWYASKKVHGKVVPTWNYTMVQARGRMRMIDDAGWLTALITRLTARHESAFEQPWAPGDAPRDYLDGMIRAIVGIEIEVQSLVGKWKLSQNRDAADRSGVVAGLTQQARRNGNALPADPALPAAGALAAWMRAAATDLSS